MGASRNRNSFDRTGFALKLPELGFGGLGRAIDPFHPASDGPNPTRKRRGAHQVTGYNDLFVMYAVTGLARALLPNRAKFFR